MTREEKSLVIENLTAQLAENNVIYVTDLTGLNAEETTSLRRACFKANIIGSCKEFIACKGNGVV